MNMPTLEEYVTIEQDFVDVTVYRKNQSWQPTHYFLDDDVPFESIGLTLPVSEIDFRVNNEDMQHYREKKSLEEQQNDNNAM